MRRHPLAAAALTCSVLAAGTAVALGSSPSGPRQMAVSQTARTMFRMMSGPDLHESGEASLDDRRAAAELKRIREATDRFHNIASAETAGYVQLKDVDGISCIAEPGMGGMGVHYVNPEIIANPAIDARLPEALVFAPDRDGTLRLAALEYLVDAATWNASHPAAGHGAVRPVVFRGHPFDLTAAPNRFGLPAFYSQHVWAWKENRTGRLSMWNPSVNCEWA